MRKSIFVAKAGLVVAVLTAATVFAPPLFADEVAATSEASGTVAAAASSTESPATTSSEGNVSFTTSTETTQNDQGEGAASSNSLATATAEATAGGGSVALTVTSNAETSVSSTATTKGAAADAAASGTIGLANLDVAVHAEATSGPDQMTASANASDGSFALAEKGIVNGVKSFVPGGVTKLLQNKTGFESISCNAGGTCSRATMTNDSVSAGIKILANTDTATAGNVDAILRAFLSVEVSAGWYDVAAMASSNISGSGTSKGTGYSASVSANVGSSGNSGIWRVTSFDNGKVKAISANVWLQGEKMCASTQIHATQGQHGLKTVVKCQNFKKNKTSQKIVFVQQSRENWLTKLFRWRSTARK
jgi:hypothetical protein